MSCTWFFGIGLFLAFAGSVEAAAKEEVESSLLDALPSADEEPQPFDGSCEGIAAYYTDLVQRACGQGRLAVAPSDARMFYYLKRLAECEALPVYARTPGLPESDESASYLVNAGPVKSKEVQAFQVAAKQALHSLLSGWSVRREAGLAILTRPLNDCSELRLIESLFQRIEIDASVEPKGSWLLSYSLEITIAASVYDRVINSVPFQCQDDRAGTCGF